MTLREAMTSKWDLFSTQNLLLGAGILIYLAAFGVVWVLGFIYAVPLLVILPAIGYYLFQSLLKPVLLLIPMFAATYLGDVASVIPEGTIPLTLFQIFLLLTITAFFLNYLICDTNRFRTLGVELELLLLFTLISFSIMYSPNRGDALLTFTRMIFLVFMLYLIINILKDRVHFFWIFGLMTVLAFILGVLSIRSALLDPLTAALNIQAGGTRIIGRGAITIRDPNVFATLFFVPIAVTTSIFLSELRYKWRIPALLTTLGLLAGLASTYSRSAWIATAFMLLMLVIYYRQYKMMIITFLLVMVVIMSIPELRNLTLNIVDRLLNIFAGSEDDSSRIRILLGMAAINMFFDSWMMGIGFRGFPEYFTNYFNLQESIGVYEPHNIIYEVLAELGIIGFGLVLLFMFAIYKKASQNFRMSGTEHDRIIAATLIASLTAFVIFYQFYGGAFVSTNMWAVIGLILAHGYYLKTTQNRLPKTGPAPPQLPAATDR